MYVMYFEHTLSIALKMVKYLQSILETQGFKSLSIEASENFSKPVLSSYFLLSLHIFVSRKLRSDQGQPLRKAMDGKVGEIIILLAPSCQIFTVGRSCFILSEPVKPPVGGPKLSLMCLRVSLFLTVSPKVSHSVPIPHRVSQGVIESLLDL